jgi:hypothetical protein
MSTRRTVTLYAADFEAAVYGLTATNDAAVELLLQLEAMLPREPTPAQRVEIPARSALTPQAVAFALTAHNGKRDGCGRDCSLRR